ncbi:MAG: IPT/TIG domain-containing protein [Xenococcus sp. MO_188.B8]|nr:IPT/TIG domain-containing protein [Xenococcus sp. MO_188.B8]
MERKNSSLLGSLVNLFRRVLDRLFRIIFRPVTSETVIDSFYPIRGCPGIEIEITGSNFSTDLHENAVRVGGTLAHVIEASPTRIKIITSYLTKTGSVEVEVRGRRANGPVNFQVLGWPDQRLEDGPPILFTGIGNGSNDKDMPSTGDQNVLIVLCHAADADSVPPDPRSIRNAVENTFEQVRTYYQQVSYRRLNLIPTVTTGWCILDHDHDYYFTELEDSDRRPLANYSGIPPQAARFASEEGLEALGVEWTPDAELDYLDNFPLIISMIYLGRDGAEAKTLDDSDLLQYSDLDIDIRNPSFLWSRIVFEDGADWRTWAHEIGHCMVNNTVREAIEAEYGPNLGDWREAAILGEDLYRPRGIPADISAASFDLMGHHRKAPLFSAYHMEQLGYYELMNIQTRSREDLAEPEEFYVVAHGVNENSDPERCHLVKIQVAPGLLYYIEVRQRPDPDDLESQVFDREIFLPEGSTLSGGVVVTKVFIGTVNMNQRMRFITALRLPFGSATETQLPEPPVLIPGEIIIDPARNLRIEVNEIVSERPLTYRVRVEWSPVVDEEVPSGDIRLRIDQPKSYATPDIWVNRQDNDDERWGYRRYDIEEDPSLDPDGNWDRPRVDTNNEIFGRVHCDGPSGESVSNVVFTFYSVTPPGVGDNGNWAPLGAVMASSIDTGESAIDTGESAEGIYDKWKPEIGGEEQHTCLKLYATAELPNGDKLQASAQENIFEFLEAEDESIPKPVVFPLAVRNPRKERVAALISVRNVPEGFVAQFPHAWVWLDPLQERRMALTIIPTYDYAEYEQREIPYANIKVSGWIPRHYREEIAPGVYPLPRLLPIGGVLVRVTPKRKVTLSIWEDQQRSRPDIAVVSGEINPAMGSEVITVEIEDPAGQKRSIKTATDDSGHFTASFNLRHGSPDAGPTELLHGVYVARALIIVSPHAAQAESNMIYLRR